jgi:hypothetical protein
MRIGEDHPVLCKLIEIWSGDFSCGIQAGEFAIPEIVGQKNDHVRPVDAEALQSEEKKNEGEAIHQGGSLSCPVWNC